MRERKWRVLDRTSQKECGLLLAFLGPDGVGKSSVISHVECHLAPVFRRTARFHLRPHFNKRHRDSAAVTDPHGAYSRGIWASALKVVWWWVDYVGGYYGNVYPRSVRSTLVIFDRYADDLAIDPKRYRYGGPLWLARLLARAVPRPDLVFVLVADPGIIQSRKAEVPLAETARQVEQYRRLAKDKGLVLVEAGRPLEDVAREVIEQTVTWLEQRTQKRFWGMP